MLKLIHLFLPAIMPSWRFFDRIMPSPRIEVALLRSAGDKPDAWRVFNPLPRHVPFSQMLGRMVWNPARNEALFLVSLAERVVAHESEHAMHEIAVRVRRRLHCDRARDPAVDHPYFKYRLIFVERQEGVLAREVAYVSDVLPFEGALYTSRQVGAS